MLESVLESGPGTQGGSMSAPPEPVRPAGNRPWLAQGLLLASLAAAIVGGVFLWMSTWSAKQRAQARSHLQQIGLALHQYHDAVGHFPAAYVPGLDGRPQQSWRTVLLPYLGEADLAAAYRGDEDWQSDQNRTLLARRPEAYANPGWAPPERSQTRLVAVVGPRAMWPEQYALSREQVRDGTSNTVMLLESRTVTPYWTEPRDLSHDDVADLRQQNPQKFQQARGGTTLVLFADGRVRAVALDRIDEEIWNGLLSPNGGQPLAGVDWPPEVLHVIDGTSRLPEVRPSTAFHRTNVVATPDAPLQAGRNTAYCCTLQLAWQQLAQRLGEPPKLTDGSALAESFSARPFSEEFLNPRDYLATAASAAEVGRIESELAQRFPGVTSQLLPNVSGATPDVFVLFAFLQKSLGFVAKYEALTEPLPFATTDGAVSVPAFGFRKLDEDRSIDRQWRDQIAVLRYQPAGDIVLRLDVRGGADEIYLARIPRPETLQAAIEFTLAAATEKSEPPATGDQLAVPVLSLGIQHEFPELARREIVGFPQRIQSAHQIIRFRLDELGAVLRSEALVIGEFGSSDPPPSHPWRLVFDRPFLVLLRQRDAAQPYFALWVEDPRLE
jgi:hypothetical protein